MAVAAFVLSLLPFLYFGVVAATTQGFELLDSDTTSKMSDAVITQIINGVFLSVPLFIAALVLGSVSLRQKRAGKGFARAAVIVSIVGILVPGIPLAVLLFGFFVTLFGLTTL